jgi:hypothetical protein
MASVASPVSNAVPTESQRLGWRERHEAKALSRIAQLIVQCTTLYINPEFRVGGKFLWRGYRPRRRGPS